MAYLILTFIDASGEKSTVSIGMDNVAADGANWASLLTQAATIRQAVTNFQGGALYEWSFVAERNRMTNIAPESGEREDKWLVRYESADTKKVFSFEIPNRLWSMHPRDGVSDFIDIHDAPNSLYTSLKAALEGGEMKAPNGENITILSIQAVGRNV